MIPDVVSPVQHDPAILLAGSRVSLSLLRAHPDQYTRLFVRARAEDGRGWCLCRPHQQVPLVIRCRSGRYHLARWPGQAHTHLSTCTWFRPEPSLSGRPAGDIISEGPNGTRLRLATPLLLRSAQNRSGAPIPATDTESAPSSRRLGLLGLLHYVWEETQLSLWPRGAPRRDWRHHAPLLHNHAQTCTTGHRPLSSALYVVPPYTEQTAEINAERWNHFLTQLGTVNGRSTARRGLVLGQLRGMTPSRYGFRVRLAHLRAPLFATSNLYERLRSSYRPAFTEHAHSRYDRILLGVVDRSARGNALLADAAVMPTAPGTGLPVDSSHELRMAHALTSAGHTVLKPLHYDSSDAVFPDFVLPDEDPAVYVEVWGLPGRTDYETRKRDKREHYRQREHRLLEWTVTDPFPTITAPKYL